MEFVISHLSQSYGTNKVLVDVDYAFEEGKIYGLLGRNGAGKTTLFNCLKKKKLVRMTSDTFYPHPLSLLL